MKLSDLCVAMSYRRLNEQRYVNNEQLVQSKEIITLILLHYQYKYVEE